MAKTNITLYSSTPSENTDIDDINIDELCPASNLNNALRSLLSHLKNVDTGSQALTALSVTGDLTVDTDTLHVDSTNNRVSIGTTSPARDLHIHGADSDTHQLHITNSSTGSTSNDGVSFALGSDESLIINQREANNIRIFTSDTERMRIDSSGALLIGKTSSDNTTVGGRFLADGFGSLVRDGNKCITLNRKTSDGEIIDLQQDNSTIGGIYSSPSITGPFIGHINVGLAMYHVGNSVLPSGTGGLRDNAIDLGNSFNRFDDIYATNSTIQTSDRNEKQDIEELSEAEQRVAVVAKGLMRKFRWIDSVAEKGDNARTHFGIIAQDLQDAFTAEGLDAGDYAMFTSTTLWEKEISVDAVEADEENGIEAQEAYTYRKIAEEATEGYTERTRLGVRYNQLLAFIISAL